MQNSFWLSGKIVLLAMIIGGLAMTVAVAKGPGGGGGEGGKPSGETTAGNNLSFPVIWAEGVDKILPGTAGMTPVTAGEWWYQWGTNGIDPDIYPASCLPDNDAEALKAGRFYCDDGVAGKLTTDNVQDCEIDPDGPDLEGFDYCNDEQDGLLSGLKFDCSRSEYDPDGMLDDVSYYCDDGVEGTVDLSLVAGEPAADNPLPLVKAYVQKDSNNIWQASSWPFPLGIPGSPINVDLIDWSDSLESVDWYTRSQVRLEVVLFEDEYAGDSEGEGFWPLDPEYEMRHVDGWGIDEVHGLAVGVDDNTPLTGPGTRATVYSHCARLTIQLLLTDRDDTLLPKLIWEPGDGWKEPLFDSAAQYSTNDVVRYDSVAWVATGDIPYISQAPPNGDYWGVTADIEDCMGDVLPFDPTKPYQVNNCVPGPEGIYYIAIKENLPKSDPPDTESLWQEFTGLINPPIFNKPVWDAGDGPGYFSAEINVKGRIIYGYTWNVRNLHDGTLNEFGAGDYRITFSFDQECGTTDTGTLITLNTHFVDGVTDILVPLEEEILAAAAAEESESTEGGAKGVKDFENNLTYMDVRILERGGGGGGNGGGKPTTGSGRPK